VADLSKLPKVDVLSRSDFLNGFSTKVCVEAARIAIGKMRQEGVTDPDVAKKYVVDEATRLSALSLTRVINASGVILHTGLGRARLAPSVAEHVYRVAADHTNLELDLETGKRGDRQSHVRGMLCELTGAEDAYVVNNCAAAVFLTLHALARRKEVILSRGQMVEIGGSFRMSEIVKQSGCKLVEVGTTNKTRLSDYEEALTPRTAAVLRCHPSNFKVVGFTEEVSPGDLANLAHERGCILIDDVGSGYVQKPLSALPEAAILGEAVKAGADIVMASGDKLLGGPQAGLILGPNELIAKIKKDPLARVTRIDKLSLAALEATLKLIQTGKEYDIPTMRYLLYPDIALYPVACELQHAYGGEAVVQQGITEVGGGSLPGAGVPTYRVGLKSSNPAQLARKLRRSKPPVLTRIEDDLVWLDPRTLDPQEVEVLKNILMGLS
jgi:L-seryl-tRNA(Ser) seleniumtransferase